MNNKNYETFKHLTQAEARLFFQLYVGLSCFNKNETIDVLTKTKMIDLLKEKNTNINLQKSYSYKYLINAKDGDYLLLYSNKKIIKYYFNSQLDNNVEYLSINNYSSDISDDIVEILLLVCKNGITSENDQEKIYVTIVKSLKEKFRPIISDYRFVLGSGVGFSYGMPLWSKLEYDFIASNKKLLNINDKEHQIIIESIFNNNYGTFQITKDLDVVLYQNLLYNMISKSTKVSDTDVSSLIAVAKVLKKQSEKGKTQKVLTFNYDGLLEEALVRLNTTYKTIYKYDKVIDFKKDVNIVHSHGYLPKCNPTNKNFKSIVLTTREYIDNYKNTTSYGYDELFKHLDESCYFIGNSLTDYEEQKVIVNHFNKKPHIFHFYMGAIKGFGYKTILYKTIYLLRMGVIPLWYYSHDDYIKELIAYSNN